MISAKRLSAALPLAVFACGNPAQSALHSAGPPAHSIETFWWTTLYVLTAVFGIVMLFLWRALRRTPAPPADPAHKIPPAEQTRLFRAVSAGLAATIFILLGFLTADLLTGRALAAIATPDPAVTIEVTGYQWWWQVRYLDAKPSDIVTTANELHIPVGVPVLLQLRSTDVIHSFWVPALHGKKDLIPGYVNQLWLQVDRPGVYYGQCAEFCGFQHANMHLVVVAEDTSSYRKWLQNERSSGLAPADSVQQRGLRVFLDGSCVMCHSIAGTDAAGKVGPDLTHIGRRLRLAAGTVPNTRSYLAEWILNPHSVKPGVKMPANPMPNSDLQALTAYLEHLK